MQAGDRVRIVRISSRHPDFAEFVGAVGTVVDIAEPLTGDSEQRLRFKVEFDQPMGAREVISIFPFSSEELEIIM